MAAAADIVFESIKLIAQLTGAIVVARVSVNWALDRYKSEKIWERQLSAYVDIITALREMRTQSYAWWSDAEAESETGISHFAREQLAAQQASYSASRNKVEEVITVGELLLPDETQETLELLMDGLDTFDIDTTLAEDREKDSRLLSQAIIEITAQGRRVIRKDPKRGG